MSELSCCLAHLSGLGRCLLLTSWWAQRRLALRSHSCLGRCEKGLVTYEMRQQFGRLDGHASIPTSTWTSSESNTFQPTTRNLAVAEANLGTVAGDRLTTGTYLLCSRLNDSTAIRHSSEPGVGLAISSIASAVPKVRMTTKGKSRWPTAKF